MANLSVEVAGIRFPNPIMPAAGPPVRDGRGDRSRCAAGRGRRARRQDRSRGTRRRRPTPNMAEIEHGLGMVNTELWSELPPEQWIEREYAIARDAPGCRSS